MISVKLEALADLVAELVLWRTLPVKRDDQGGTHDYAEHAANLAREIGKKKLARQIAAYVRAEKRAEKARLALEDGLADLIGDHEVATRYVRSWLLARTRSFIAGQK